MIGERIAGERIYGPMNLGPSGSLVAPGGILGAVNMPGTIWCVNGATGGSDSWAGYPWSKAFATITKALAVASPYDIILVGIQYATTIEAGTLVVTQKGLKILGNMTSELTWGQPTIKGGLADNMELINLKADSVEIFGIGFHQLAAKLCIGVAEDAWGLNTWRSHLHHCCFGGNGVATYGVYAGGVGTDAPYTIVEDCRFDDFVTVAVRNNGSSCMTRRNIIQVPTGAVGIQDVQNSSSRPYRKILSNKVSTTDPVNGVGIQVVNTPSPGQLVIDDNHLVGFADNAHACDVCGSGKAGLMGLNYFGITALPIS